MKWSAIRRTVGATAAAVALAITGAATASATGDDPTPPVSEITQDSGSLTINKYTPTTDGADRPANGTEYTIEPASGAKPIQGVEFTVYKVTGTPAGSESAINTTTNAGWQAIDQLLTNVGTQNPTLAQLEGQAGISVDSAATETLVTDADGKISLTNLDLGLYYVVESTPDDKDVTIIGGGEDGANRTLKAGGLMPSAPFLVTIPMTNPEGNQWMYDINVYPKNTPTEITKSVKDDPTPGTGNTVGEEVDSIITYTVETPIPATENGLKYFTLVDQLDILLAYQQNSSVVTIVDSDTELIKDVDYTVHVTPVNKDYKTEKHPDGFSDQVSIVFTEAGLKKLDANATKQVRWEFKVNVNDTTGATDIYNDAWLIPNDPGNTWGPDEEPDTPPPGEPSEEVVSKYGSVEITKKNAADGSVLAGAEFELYTCDKDANLGDKVTVDDVNKWTSNEQGLVKIDGLQLNDFKNNSKVIDGVLEPGATPENWKDTSFYCLVEVKAPEGFELLPEPHKFQITTDDADYKYSADLDNVPSDGGFKLPLTGSVGIGIAVLAGLLFIGGSVLYTIRVRRS